MGKLEEALLKILQKPQKKELLEATLEAPWKDRLPGGADEARPEEVPHKALLEGAAHEMEHTRDPRLALEIALDHLVEDRAYYKKLKRLEKAAQEEHFHGSPHKLTHLREGSWVTPYQEDAAVFGAPWGSDDLHYKGGPDGRPPKKLRFKGPPPKDHPVYVYSVKGPTKGARTNTGGEYEWNRQTTSELPATLVKVLPSWHKAFLKGPMEKAAAGLWDNIHAKRARIALGSKERMRKPGAEGAPTAKALRESKEKTASHEYDDSYMLGRVLSRLSGQAEYLRQRVSDGTELPSWAEYKLYSAYDNVLCVLGTLFEDGGKGPLSKKAAQAFAEEIEKLAEVEYHGKKFPGYNEPIPSDKKDKKMMVLAKDGEKVKLIHFGQKGYQHNYSPEAKADYLKRSAGIRDKSGNLTKDDKMSPNYWARRVLWPKGPTGHGKNGPVDTNQ